MDTSRIRTRSILDVADFVPYIPKYRLTRAYGSQANQRAGKAFSPLQAFIG